MRRSVFHRTKGVQLLALIIAAGTMPESAFAERGGSGSPFPSDGCKENFWTGICECTGGGWRTNPLGTKWYCDSCISGDCVGKKLRGFPFTQLAEGMTEMSTKVDTRFSAMDDTILGITRDVRDGARRTAALEQEVARIDSNVAAMSDRLLAWRDLLPEPLPGFPQNMGFCRLNANPRGVTVRVRNAGFADVENTDVVVIFKGAIASDGTKQNVGGSAETGAIRASDFRDVVVPLPDGFSWPAGGDYSFDILVDIGNAVQEINEANNSVSVSCVG